MRYNHLLALPVIAGLLTAASGLAMAASSVATAEPVNLGFAAAAVVQPAGPSYALLAMDDRPGSVDKPGRIERAERDRVDHQRPERPDRPERAHR
jgi:hypothetical protein